MATIVRPERTMIGGSLEIPRIINGLWQFAGGHDSDVDIAHAPKGMNPLIVKALLLTKFYYTNGEF
jgi:hypothetical protein